MDAPRRNGNSSDDNRKSIRAMFIRNRRRAGTPQILVAAMLLVGIATAIMALALNTVA